ncbi:MAG: hypothetical protein FJY07_06290 [Bacteroidetes bacterium]|nr:hypothetical protein [Bacteroidota bacterium]
MKFKYTDFLRKLLIYTVIIGILSSVFIFLLPDGYITPTLPYLIFFFFSVTLIVHLVLINVSEKKTPSFINYFMLLTFGKLIFFLTIILIYALLNRDDAIPFILSFFVLYLLYTAFEVVLSLAYVKRKKEESEQIR